MEPIFPLEEDYINRFRGLPVLVVMQDGSRHIGLLGGAYGGRIRLNGDAPPGDAGLSHAGRRRKRTTGRRRLHPNVHEAHEPAATPPGPPGPPAASPFGPPVTLELSQTAYLFLLLA